MKRILISGKDSYIGTSVETWLMRDAKHYEVDTLDMKDKAWKEKDFSQYDAIIHVAGIAHIKETKKNKKVYEKINRDLAYATAKKAQLEGVKQFIFLSSMSVYGVSTGCIDKNTPLQPKSAYGKSKLEAEELINKLQDHSFNVVILRPPMIYGGNCKGNYPRLARLILKMPFFPQVENRRSMLYIEHLAEFIKHLIDDEKSGLFFPQNAEYVNVSEMVQCIARVHNKSIIMTKLFNPLLKLIRIRSMNKVFGDLVYEMSLSEYEKHYRICRFEESIKRTELGS